MLIRLLSVVILVPLAEILVLIESGRLIGVWPTVLLVVLTGIAGSWLLRHQGLAVLGQIQAELATGQLPGGTLLDGALVLAGGLLLLTPGFCTDLAGFTMRVRVHKGLRSLTTAPANRIATGRTEVNQHGFCLTWQF